MMFPRIVFAVAALVGFAALVPLYLVAGSYTYYALLGTVATWRAHFCWSLGNPFACGR